MEMTNREWVILWMIADDLLTKGNVKLSDLDEEDIALLKRIKEEI